MHPSVFHLIDLAAGVPIPVTLSPTGSRDHPLIFANDAFCKMTGYSLEQVKYRSCRFLQGTLPRQENANLIRRCLRQGLDVTVPLLNVRANGDLFPNLVFISRLTDLKNQPVAFMGCQYDLTQASDEKDILAYQDRLNAIFQDLKVANRREQALIASRVRMTESTLAAARQMVEWTASAPMAAQPAGLNQAGALV